jgi:ethanolamine ammonia-lyase small subunit
MQAELPERAEHPIAESDAATDLWYPLRKLTAARIGLRRSGASLATEPLLASSLAHARARDAVHEAIDEARLSAEAAALLARPIVVVDSAAPDRRTYLMRPDLGRRPNRSAAAVLASHAGDYDLVAVIADGLSARAVQCHALPVLAAALPTLRDEGWRIAPPILVRQGRVAVGDAIAAHLGAAAVCVLIGERPGLSSPDSMSLYVTWRPGSSTTDAERNCISNVRPEGVSYAEAAFKLIYLLRKMRSRGFSGVALKDDSDNRHAHPYRIPPNHPL